MKKTFQFLEGEVLLINKPLHWTSFQLVNKLRWLIKRKLGIKKIKVGHAGTLDPLASGLMIICTGKKTKEISQHQATEKEYIATLKLGATTPSYDGETEETYFYPTKHISKELIISVCNQFIGEIEQLPPIFSAIKVKGKKLYQSARKGNKVEIKPRIIRINEIEIISMDLPYIKLRVSCSKGTYIRSLAHDLGKAMNTGAWLCQLQRTKIGTETIKNAIDINDFQQMIKSF
jgi:tRNA pseudouridine55 synthase